MARSTDELPVLAGSASPIGLLPLRRGAAVRVAGLAMLLLRALAIVLLLSPMLMAAALLLV